MPNEQDIMSQNIVLVDGENGFPESIEKLAPETFRVLIFLGENQKQIPIALATGMQRMGNRSEYVKITGNGKNALDFHIAYYIGTLSAAEPKAFFHIISKDTGFDPLIKFLKSRDIFAARSPSISEIPLLKAPQQKTFSERLKIASDYFELAKTPKPRSVKTLSNSIAALFQKQLTEPEITEIIEGLKANGMISISSESKIAYRQVPSA